MNQARVIKMLGELFREKKISCVLVGGVAVNYYGFSRHTRDIDFMILVDDFDKIVADLSGVGYSEFDRRESFIRLVNKDPDLMVVDFLFVDNESMAEIIKSGQSIELYGERFILPSLNHLLAMKFHSIKQNPELREMKDLLDIATLIKGHNIDVYSDAFKNLCLKYGTLDILSKLQLFFANNK